MKKKKKKIGSGIEEYKIIDEAENQEKCIGEIDKFYSDKSEVSGLIDNNVVFRRKAYLMTRLKDNGREKSFWCALAPVLVSAILGIVLNGNMVGCKLNELPNRCLSIVSAIIVLLIFLYIVALFVAIFNEKETDWDQIKKYELLCIEKALESHMPQTEKKSGSHCES